MVSAPALRAAAGILSGLIVWGVAAAVGVAAVLATSATAFMVLKLAGAAYPVYLGARAIERVTGTVLIALGVRLPLERR